jgi:hypothetical protein
MPTEARDQIQKKNQPTLDKIVKVTPNPLTNDGPGHRCQLVQRPLIRDASGSRWCSADLSDEHYAWQSAMDEVIDAQPTGTVLTSMIGPPPSMRTDVSFCRPMALLAVGGKKGAHHEHNSNSSAYRFKRRPTG